MNSEYGKKLSQEELKKLNMPTPVQASTPAPMPQIIIENTMPEEFANQLIQTQESILYKLDSVQSSIGMKASADDVRKLTRSVEQLRSMVEQAGKEKERKRLPRLRLPRLYLPHPDGPTVVVLVLIPLTLLLIWFFLGRGLSSAIPLT